MRGRPKDSLAAPQFPYSLHKAGGWRGQWHRVRRWHSRVQTGEPVDREDFLYAFFQNCASLRDWLKYDRPESLEQRELEDLVKNHVELRLCQDISNATKHLQLSDPKMRREFAQAREYVPAPVKGGSPSSTIVLLADGQKYDALVLVDRCVEIWRSFLKTHSLDQ